MPCAERQEVEKVKQEIKKENPKSSQVTSWFNNSNAGKARKHEKFESEEEKSSKSAEEKIMAQKVVTGKYQNMIIVGVQEWEKWMNSVEREN